MSTSKKEAMRTELPLGLRLASGSFAIVAFVAVAALVYFPPATNPTGVTAIATLCFLLGAVLSLYALNGRRLRKVKIGSAGVEYDDATRVRKEVESIQKDPQQKQLLEEAASPVKEDNQKAEVEVGSPPTNSAPPDPSPPEPPPSPQDAPQPIEPPVVRLPSKAGQLNFYTLTDVSAQVLRDALVYWPSEQQPPPADLSSFEFAMRAEGTIKKRVYPWILKFRGKPALRIAYDGRRKRPTVTTLPH